MPRGLSAPISRTADSPAWRWIRAGLIAALIASACAVAVKITTKKVRDLTPDELRSELESGHAQLDTVIQQLNRMDFEGRRSVMQSPDGQHYVQNLKPVERKRLVVETLDRGIAMQLERFHKMSKDERAGFIAEVTQRQQEDRERFLKLPKSDQDARRNMLNDVNIEEVVEKAVKAYLSVSTSEERAELAPLYEGALENVRMIKGADR